MHRDTDTRTVGAAGDLHLIYTRLVTRRQGFEFSSRCERATHLALPMCGFERVAALILEPVSKGAGIDFFAPPAVTCLWHSSLWVHARQLHAYAFWCPAVWLFQVANDDMYMKT